FRVDDRAWNLHDEILLGIADVDEFCFHFWIGGVPCTPPGSLHSAYQPSPRSAVSSRAKAGGGGTRTPTACGQEILSLSRLPISPRRPIFDSTAPSLPVMPPAEAPARQAPPSRPVMPPSAFASVDATRPKLRSWQAPPSR